MGALLRIATATLALLAIMACGGSAGEPVSSPTPPPGMFSTLPTTEPPIVGDQPPTIELNTPGTDVHAQTDPYAQSHLYSRAHSNP